MSHWCGKERDDATKSDDPRDFASFPPSSSLCVASRSESACESSSSLAASRRIYGKLDGSNVKLKSKIVRIPPAVRGTILFTSQQSAIYSNLSYECNNLCIYTDCNRRIMPDIYVCVRERKRDREKEQK